MRGVFMKRKIYVGVVVFVMVVVLAGAVLFVFWDDVLGFYDNMNSEEGGSGFAGDVEVVGEVGVDIESPDVEDLGSGGGSGGGDDGGSGGGPGGAEVISCDSEQVQYSLKNFRNDVLCLESGVVGCVKVGVNCSFEVYNFDDGIDDVFEVSYSLVDSNKDELDFRLIGREVGGVEVGRVG